MENTLNVPLLSDDQFNWDTRMVTTPPILKEQTDVTKINENQISISVNNETEIDSKMEDENKHVTEIENSTPTTIFPFPQKKCDVLPVLKRGTSLLKKGSHGKPHFHQFNLSEDNSKLVWYSKNKTLDQSCIQIKEMKKIIQGETAKKFDCADSMMSKSGSFTVLYGEDKSLNLKAKSVNEMKMWIQALQLLHQLSQKGIDLSKISKLEVEVDFRDCSPRQSSQFSNENSIESHETKEYETIDPVLQRKLLNELKALKKKLIKAVQESQSLFLERSYEYCSIKEVLNELKERVEQSENELKKNQNTNLAAKDVWLMKIDLECLREKIHVICNQNEAKIRHEMEYNADIATYHLQSWNIFFFTFAA